MGRPKKEQPNSKDGTYEVKITVGKNFDISLIRKSFYSFVQSIARYRFHDMFYIGVSDKVINRGFKVIGKLDKGLNIRFNFVIFIFIDGLLTNFYGVS